MGCDRGGCHTLVESWDLVEEVVVDRFSDPILWDVESSYEPICPGSLTT
jgi:hypothetical protein